MNFKALQDEVIALRFNEGKRASVKLWLNLRYSWLWTQAEWEFKRVPPTTLAVVSGNRTPVMPTDFGTVNQVFDDQGSELLQLDPGSWNDIFQWDSSSSRPTVYAVDGRQLYLGPTPNTNYSFKIAYERRVSHVETGPVIVGGGMVNDADQPLWATEYDYVLVLEAAMLGMQFEKDDGWTLLKPQRDELLAAMIADLTEGSDAPRRQWGKVGC